MSLWRYFFQKTRPRLDIQRVTQEQRMRFNPLRGFDPDKLVTAIDSYRIGHIDPLSRIIEELEERDDIMTSCARKNRASLGRCPHTILTTEGYEGDERAELHKKVLTRFYANINVTSALVRNQRGGIRLLKQQMSSSISRRYAVHEIVWHPQPNGEISATFVHVPNWFFESRTGELRFLETPGAYEGTQMLEGEWLVTVGDGVGIASAVLAMSKVLSRNDWLLFSERCGQPGLHVATDAAQDSDPWRALVGAVRNFGREWSIVTDNATKLSPIDLNTGGQLPYEPLIDLCNKGIAVLYRGADLSTLSGDVASSTGASVQGEETDLLEQDTCELLSETLNSQVDPFVIRYVTGDEIPLAYISISPTDQPNIDQDTKIDNHLVDLGVQLSRNDALARYGRTLYDASNQDDAPLKRTSSGYPGQLYNTKQPPHEPAPGATPLQNAKIALQNGASAPDASTGGKTGTPLKTQIRALARDLETTALNAALAALERGDDAEAIVAAYDAAVATGLVDTTTAQAEALAAQLLDDVAGALPAQDEEE